MNALSVIFVELIRVDMCGICLDLFLHCEAGNVVDFPRRSVFSLKSPFFLQETRIYHSKGVVVDISCLLCSVI